MVETDAKGKEVKWVYDWPNETTLVLATCGVWEAQLARIVYSKGQVFIFPKPKTEANVPDFLGEKKIPDSAALIRLIEDISMAMVKANLCEKVYLVSLNESKTEKLHFWLIPRNDLKHKDFLANEDEDGEKTDDGFTLMAKLRNDWVDRSKSKEWGCTPPPPSASKADWRKYAEDYQGKFERVRPKDVEER